MKRFLRVASLALALLLALSGLALAEELPMELPEFELPEAASEEAAPETENGPEAAVAAPEAVPEGETAAPEEAPAENAEVSAAEAVGIQLNATALTLGVKETFELLPVLPEGMTGITFGYASSNPKVAPVSQTGVVTAKKKGTATIAVKASNGEQFACQVTVLKAPKKITLSASSGTLGFDSASGAGTSYKLGVEFPKGTGAQVKFGGYDANVLSVSADGVLTAVGVGTTTVTAGTFNGKKASCKVTVLGAPESIAFADEALQMIEKEKRKLALVVPEGTVACATFESDNAAVATVNADTGEITAVGQGSCVITARSFNGKTASCALSVLPGPDKIVLPGSTVLLGLGDQALLGAVPVRSDGAATGTGLKYVSSKTQCVTVDADGTLTGKKKGSAKITVTAPNGVTASCTVKVMKAPGSISLSAVKSALQFAPDKGIAEQTKLKATLPKNTASSITFSGWDPSVISVTEDGTVTAVGIGTTSVTATTYNGKTGSCNITVCAVGAVSTDSNVVVVAHRGGAGSWTENTLSAFANAPTSGADAIELDARSTKDGVQVVHHDATFTVDGKKYTIKKLKWAQLHQLKPSVCTLDEALAAVAAGGLDVNLELKDTANAKSCVAAIKKHGLEKRVMYISFLPKQLAQVKKLSPSAPLGLCFHETPKDLSATLSSLKLKYVFQDKAYLTADSLKGWQNSGLKVGVWTVNDAEAIRNWLALGVDYITSDYPARVTEILR